MNRTEESMDLPADSEQKPIKAISQVPSITKNAAVCLKEPWARGTGPWLVADSFGDSQCNFSVATVQLP